VSLQTYNEAMKVLIATPAEDRVHCTRIDYAKTISKVLDERDVLIANLLHAIKSARDVGCIDHLDCWEGKEGADVCWYPAIEAARNHLKERGVTHDW
jgi:hypothetical protein